MSTKSWIRIVTVASAAALSGAPGLAGAAPPDDEPTLKVEVKEKLALVGKLSTKAGEAPFSKCQIGDKGTAVAVPKDQTIGPVQVDDSGPSGVLLRHALAGDSLRCIQGGQPRQVKLGAVTSAVKKTMSTSVPVFAPSFAWELGSSAWGLKILSAFGAAKSCTAAGGDGKDIGCTLDTSSGDIKFTLAGKITSGQVVLHLEEKTEKMDLTIPVDACRIELRGELPFIVAGAVGQRLTLAKQSSDRSCSFLVDKATKIVIGQNSISLNRPSDKLYSKLGEVERDAGPIPEGVTAGVFDAEIHGSSGPIAVARVDVVTGLKAAEKLFVEYDRENISDPFGQFESASGEADGRNAVIDPVLGAPDAPPLVSNTTDIVVPPQLPSATGLPSLPRNSKLVPASEIDPSTHTIGSEQRFVWALQNSEASGRVNFSQCDATDGWKLDGTSCVFNDGIGSVKFDVHSATAQAIKPVFWLMRLQSWNVASVPPKTEAGTVWTATPLLKAPVEIAKAARRESIALPIRTLLEVECLNVDGSTDAKAFANDTKAIDEEAVRQGRCKIRLSRRRVCALSKTESKLPGDKEMDPTYGGIDLYGPQFVKVTIQRGGAQKSELEWHFKMPDARDLADYCDAGSGELKTQATEEALARARVAVAKAAEGAPRATAQGLVDKAQEEVLKAKKAAVSERSRLVFPELTLPAPAEPTNATQVYSIEAIVEITPSANVIFRGGTLKRATGDGINTEHGHLRFVTYLRPRGLFGWSCCVRTYITATTQLGGLRFPAEPRELRNSSQSPDYQFVSPRVGVLASLEKWDYNEGVDPWPLNPTFQFGAHFLNLTDGTVELSSLVGGALTVPLVSDAGSQLGTKVTVGAYWEHNFLGKDHLLLSLSLNIGSLLSGSQK